MLLPADVLQADLRRTSMIGSVSTCFFSNFFLVQTLKSLAAECVVGVRLELRNFLTPVWWTDCFGCLHLVQVAVCFGQMSLTHFLDLGWWVGA